MLASPGAVALEHLTPHDLVTYFRCPHEMGLAHRLRAIRLGASSVEATVPREGLVPVRHSPLLAPPMNGITVVEGRLDLDPRDVAVYLDEGERGLPVLFPPEQIRLDATLHEHGGNLIDPELELSGRPDYVIRRADGSLVPIEYKATHLFLGFHEAHGRAFDVVQAIAECRLVQARLGARPPYGLVLYGDASGEGRHEGWMQVRYGPSEEGWLRYALRQVRADRERPPVPAEGHCAPCEPNREGLCQYAAVGYRVRHPIPA